MFFRSEAADGGWYNETDAIDKLAVTSKTLSAMRDAGGTLKEQRGLKCRAPAPYSGLFFYVNTISTAEAVYLCVDEAEFRECLREGSFRQRQG